MSREFTVCLEQVFQGPMDLLLHLVREQEVEIQEVKLATVIEGYFDYLSKLEDLDIEVAGEFLVMAATLMAIKARSLLPRESVELEDDLDPEDELIQRLVEYRRFKSAADDLEDRYVDRSRKRLRGYPTELRHNRQEKSFDIGELTSWDLLATFSRLMRETLQGRTVHIQGDPRPLRWYVHELGRVLSTRKRVSLRELVTDLDGEPTRSGLIGSFCALLELMRMGILSAKQEDQNQEIEIVLCEDVGTDLEDMIGAATFMDEGEEDDGEQKGDVAPG
ncbi:MAG: segregation/condensation protein A [bacterium]|nr:segregation/condensation protein A [bacterium]